MINYSKHVTNTQTPQTLPLFDRNDQVVNNAGGYLFNATSQQILERFLTIGSEGGTYYVSEQKLTQENAKVIIQMIKEVGASVVDTVVRFSESNRAPKADPAIFVLALAVTYGNDLTKKLAYNVVHNVCRTSTHLFTFVENVNAMRGWSRGLRTAVSKFYTTKTPEQVAYQLVKYRQRNGWTHRDVLRLAHPKAKNHTLNSLFNYAVGKSSAEETNLRLIQAFDLAQKTTDMNQLVNLVSENKLTWEMVPTQALKDKDVLFALLQNMPMTAMLRNLNRFASSSLTDVKTAEATKLIVSRLTDKELIRKARLHPVNILNTMKVYSQGRGEKGSLTWTPNQAIVDALQEAFELSFETVEPTGKSLLVGVDVSQSMSGPTINNMSLSPREVAAALMLTTLKTEPNTEVVWFDTRVYEVKAGKRTSYEEILQKMPLGGGTNCSLPLLYAIDRKMNVDAVVILTDNETWAGNSHALEELKVYRNKVNSNVKVAEIGMVANNYSLFPQDETNVLKVSGFDASIPTLVNNFIKG